MKRFIAIWILVSAGLNIWQMGRIAELEEKKPMVVYKADNAGAEIFGKVVEKGRHGKLYTILMFLDSVISTVSFCNGTTAESCLEEAYEVIKDRKGKMIDGVFVKEEDLA